MSFKKVFQTDWVLFLSILPLLAAGLITMRMLGTGKDYYFYRQLLWIAAGVFVFFAFGAMDWSFLRKGEIILTIFAGISAVLFFLLIFGRTIKGAGSWIKLPFFSVEPAEAAKLALILILAKYFSRRHIEIAYVKHIFVSMFYLVVPLSLVFFQPDFGSALILGLIWLGMIMISGIRKKHLFMVFFAWLLAFVIAWLFILKPYQQQRIKVFLWPLKDVRSAGYNARQSIIAVGSGRLFGKGIGFGTQSRLEFLPEHQTDFIFSAFAEEWGFAGALLVFVFYGLIAWRILQNSILGQTNFEALFGLGVVCFLGAHFFVHVGMNLGILPITGVGLPFMSYGGSNLLVVFSGLGILMGMRRYNRQVHPSDASAEFLGRY